MSRNGDTDGRGEAVQAKAADRKPAPGVEQVASVVSDIGELESWNRAIVAGFELAFVFKSQGSGSILRQAGGKRNAHGRVLGHALGRQRLIFFVEDFGDP